VVFYADHGVVLYRDTDMLDTKWHGKGREFRCGCGLFGIYHSVRPRVCSCDAFGFLDRVLSDYLHPVAVRVECKGDGFHAAVCEFLLELVAGVFDSLAGGLD